MQATIETETIGTEKLFVIYDLVIGVGDYGVPALWFTVKGLDGCALQVIQCKDIQQFISDWGLRDIKDAQGKACVCIHDGLTIRYVRPFKP